LHSFSGTPAEAVLSNAEPVGGSTPSNCVSVVGRTNSARVDGRAVDTVAIRQRDREEAIVVAQERDREPMAHGAEVDRGGRQPFQLPLPGLQAQGMGGRDWRPSAKGVAARSQSTLRWRRSAWPWGNGEIALAAPPARRLRRLPANSQQPQTRRQQPNSRHPKSKQPGLRKNSPVLRD
jgi:hypothetical protein